MMETYGFMKPFMKGLQRPEGATVGLSCHPRLTPSFMITRYGGPEVRQDTSSERTLMISATSPSVHANLLRKIISHDLVQLGATIELLCQRP